MYFIKMRHPFRGWKALNRTLYATKSEADTAVMHLNLHQHGEFAVGDADHYPDKGILLQAGP